MTKDTFRVKTGLLLYYFKIIMLLKVMEFIILYPEVY